MTPGWLFDLLDEEFDFTIDAAASSHNAQIERYWTEEIDGLAQNWKDERVFVNPPWKVKALEAWTAKARKETDWNCPVAALLVPVKSDQKWWHDHAIYSEIRFIRGRVTFSDAKGTAPIPVAVLVFGADYPAVFGSIVQPKNRK
jgi:site-specific DNA-methyltransferase (adenine-specific)